MQFRLPLDRLAGHPVAARVHKIGQHAWQQQCDLPGHIHFPAFSSCCLIWIGLEPDSAGLPRCLRQACIAANLPLAI